MIQSTRPLVADGEMDPKTLSCRSSLAFAYDGAGRLDDAILGQQDFDPREATRLFTIAPNGRDPLRHAAAMRLR